MEGCRPARQDDLPRIVEMARAVRQEVEPVRGGPLWANREALAEPLEAAYAELLADDAVLVVVGTIDEYPVGFGVVATEALHDGATLGVVRDLYVEPDAREVGVGEAMAEAVLEFCAARGCVGVDAWALPGHRMTKNFFEEQGFVSRGIVVHKPLAPDTRP